jgi:peptidyl-prolyl cis-trans isomerase C
VSEELDGSDPAQELAVRSKTRLGTTTLLACVLGTVACSPESGLPAMRRQNQSDLKGSTTSSATLPPGVVARVGSFDVLPEHIAQIVLAQHVSAKEACNMEIRDALFASGALVRRVSDTPAVAAALRGRLARALLSKIAQEAATRDPTDDEVRAATARHFVELDRPEAFRVIHAVVRVASNADAGTNARAREMAERIKRAVSHVKDPAEFRSRVEAIKEDGLQLTVEELKPVAADGRVIDLEDPRPAAQTGRYAAPFAAAAARLAQPGDQSDPVETEFGWHVLMLVERQAAHTVPFEERRRMLRDEILSGRTRQIVEELRGELRNRHKPVIERSANALLVDLSMPTQ